MSMRKTGGVIVSHGQVATELLTAAQAVVGDLNHIRAVSIDWNVDVEAAKSQIEHAIAEVSKGRGVVILTDMFGGTPTNIAAMFLKEHEVEIVTGVNLPMVVKLATVDSELTLENIAKEVEEEGKNSIIRAGTLLAPQTLKKDA